MCRTAWQIFACGMAAVVFLIAEPTRAVETCTPVSTPVTTLACKEGVQGAACDSPLVTTGGIACTVTCSRASAEPCGRAGEVTAHAGA
jgi:hypothetical protein